MNDLGLILVGLSVLIALGVALYACMWGIGNKDRKPTDPAIVILPVVFIIAVIAWRLLR